jgi:hypothetical protein
MKRPEARIRSIHLHLAAAATFAHTSFAVIRSDHGDAAPIMASWRPT